MSDNTSRRRILVTGATGYVGRRLVTAALDSGLEVVAAVRDPRRIAPAPGLTAAAYDLCSAGGLDETLAGIDTVVHLAVILDPDPGAGEDPNTRGSQRLLAAARRQRVRRFVFLSSQSAREDAPTRYGRSKWRIEQMLTAAGEIAIRPGMVSGGAPQGVYGQLLRLLKRWPVVPVIRPGAPVYPVHVDDLCAVILAAAAGSEPATGVARAAPVETTFGDYLRLLAGRRLGRRRWQIPVPAALALALARLGGALGLPVSRERVLGLAALRPMPPGDSMTDLAPEGGFRDLADALDDEGRRRRLIIEATVLGRYLLGRRPAVGAVKRYVAAVLAEADVTPLELPGLVRARPGLLRAFEPWTGWPWHGSGSEKLRRRLSLATRVVEMTPQAAPLFHTYRRQSRLVVIVALAWLVLSEAALLPLRIVAGWRASRRSRGLQRPAPRVAPTPPGR